MNEKEKAKEKAKELVDKFKDASKDQIFYDWDYYHKQCALIAVDEIIKARPDNWELDRYEGIAYWQQVRLSRFLLRLSHK